MQFLPRFIIVYLRWAANIKDHWKYFRKISNKIFEHDVFFIYFVLTLAVDTRVRHQSTERRWLMIACFKAKDRESRARVNAKSLKQYISNKYANEKLGKIHIIKTKKNLASFFNFYLCTFFKCRCVEFPFANPIFLLSNF